MKIRNPIPAFFLAILCVFTQAAVLAAEVPGSLYDLRVRTLEGEEQPLSRYRGKALLLVNTASRCGYTPQYQGLQTVYQRYRARGFEVLGFPSNDFGAQEPGTAGEIRKFCTTKYRVGFPLFEKNPVSGSAKQPVYQWLLTPGRNASVATQEVAWNFEKFLVSKDGKLLARFLSGTHPESPELVKAIEGALR